MKPEETVDFHIRAAWYGIHRMYNQEAVKYDITTSLGFVLLNLHMEVGTAATRIAPLMGMESRSLSRMLKSMEKQGLIRKEKDENDKRSVLIFLTEKGKEKREIALRGRNLVTGLPEEVLVTDEGIRRAMEKSVKQIILAVKTTVEETPPELLADIMAKGIYLTGGGSLLKGLDTLIQEEVKIPVKIVEDPMTAVVRGAGMVLENIDELSENLADSEELTVPK